MMGPLRRLHTTSTYAWPYGAGDNSMRSILRMQSIAGDQRLLAPFSAAMHCTSSAYTASIPRSHALRCTLGLSMHSHRAAYMCPRFSAVVAVSSGLPGSALPGPDVHGHVVPGSALPWSDDTDTSSISTNMLDNSTTRSDNKLSNGGSKSSRLASTGSSNSSRRYSTSSTSGNSATSSRSRSISTGWEDAAQCASGVFTLPTVHLSYDHEQVHAKTKPVQHPKNGFLIKMQCAVHHTRPLIQKVHRLMFKASVFT